MANEGLKKIKIAGKKFPGNVPQAENAKQVALGAFQADQSEIVRGQMFRGLAMQRLQPASRDLQVRMAGGIFRQSHAQNALHIALRLHAKEADALNLASLDRKS